MFEHRKIKAFLLSLMLCISASQVTAVYAEDTTAAEAVTEEAAADSELIVSGDFSYSLTHDGTVCIEDCTSTETELVIPDTIDGLAVTELGKTAFGGLNDDGEPYSPYVTISLPSSINYISADNPFLYCEKLKEVKLADGCADYCVKDGVLYSADMVRLINYPQAKDGTSFTIPEGVQEIGSSGIYNTRLTELKFPSSLVEILRGGCAYNEKLTSVDLSGTAVTTLDTMAFASCSELSEVLLPDTLTMIGLGAFMYCTSLCDITLPDGLLTIRQSAFTETGLIEITVPASVETIEYCALGYEIGDDGSETPKAGFVIIGEIGSAAQNYSTGEADDTGNTNSFTFMTTEQNSEQKEILALERVKSGDYEYAVVNGSAVITQCTAVTATVTVPDSIDGYTVTMIYPTAFSTCMAEEIILPSTVTELREMSFYKCPNLKTIKLPDSLQKIGNNCFDSCTALESVDFGGAVEIGQSVLAECTAVKTITISGNCTLLNDGTDEPAFADCSSLESITVTKGDGEFVSQDGVLYNKDKSVLICYPLQKTESKYKAPKSLREITQSAFEGNAHIKNVDISSVTKIDAYAFMSCSNLESVKLSRDLREIGTDAFTNCDKLMSLRFYDKLETIGNFAFGYDYDPNADTENGESAETLIEGFKIYADKGTTAYKFANECHIKIVTGTIYLFGLNLPKALLGVIGALAAVAAVFAVLGRRAKKPGNGDKTKTEENKADEDNKDDEDKESNK